MVWVRCVKMRSSKILLTFGVVVVCTPTYASASGFYIAGDIGGDFSKLSVTSAGKKVSSNKFGTAVNLGAGYTFCLSPFLLSLEGIFGVGTANPSYTSSDKVTVSSKRRYSFGFTSKIGYSFPGGLSGILNAGVLRSNHSINVNESDASEKSGSTNSTSLLIGAELRYDFGQVFVRAGCDVLFPRSIVGEKDKLGSAGSLKKRSYVIRIGGGYKF